MPGYKHKGNSYGKMKRQAPKSSGKAYSKTEKHLGPGQGSKAQGRGEGPKAQQ